MRINIPMANNDAAPKLSAGRMPATVQARARCPGGRLLYVRNAVTTKTEQDLDLYFCHYRLVLASVILALVPLIRSILAVKFLNDGRVLFQGNGLAWRYNAPGLLTTTLQTEACLSS